MRVYGKSVSGPGPLSVLYTLYMVLMHGKLCCVSISTNRVTFREMQHATPSNMDNMSRQPAPAAIAIIIVFSSASTNSSFACLSCSSCSISTNSSNICFFLFLIRFLSPRDNLQVSLSFFLLLSFTKLYEAISV